jgi:hypothetical protein
MKHGTIARVAALAIINLLLWSGCSVQRTSFNHGHSSELTLNLNSDASSGTWSGWGNSSLIHGGNAWVTVRVEEGSSTWMVGSHVNRRDLTIVRGDASPGAGDGLKIELRREAGTFHCVGAMRGDEVSGTFQFEIDNAYVQKVGPWLAATPSKREWLLLALQDVSAAFVQEVKGTGLTVTANGLLRLRQNGINAEFISELRHGGCAFDIDELIKLRHAGVSAGFPVGVKKAGLTLTVDELVMLRRAGVSLEYLLDVKKADASLLSSQVIALRHAGVSSEFFGEAKSIHSGLESGEIIRLRFAGITADYLRRWKEFDFSLDEVIKLRNAGVPSEFASALKQAGYALPSDQIIKLRHAGVAADLLATVKNAGYEFSPEEIIKLRNAGVTPQYLAGLHLPGQKHLAADVIIDLRRRGVPVETVRQIRAGAN